jgi:hypothetical protein
MENNFNAPNSVVESVTIIFPKISKVFDERQVHLSITYNFMGLIVFC